MGEAGLDVEPSWVPNKALGPLGGALPDICRAYECKKKRSRGSWRGEGGKALARVAHDSQTTVGSLFATTTKSHYNSKLQLNNQLGTNSKLPVYIVQSGYQ